jgi:hypothetical protein
MEGPISFWGYKEQETHLILPEHDDDDDDDDDGYISRHNSRVSVGLGVLQVVWLTLFWFTDLLPTHIFMLIGCGIIDCL